MDEEYVTPPTSPRSRRTSERVGMISTETCFEPANPTFSRSQRANENQDRVEEDEPPRTEIMDVDAIEEVLEAVTEATKEAPEEKPKEKPKETKTKKGRRPSAEPSTSGGSQPAKRGRRSLMTRLESEQPEEAKEETTELEMTREEKRMLKTGIVNRLKIFTDEKKKSSKAAQEATVDMLKECYETVKKEYDDIGGEELLTDYLLAVGNDGDNIFRQHAIANNYELPTLEFANLQISEDNFTRLSEITPETTKYGKELGRARVPSFPIPVGDIRPPMNYWIPIEQSITTDDRKRLTHVPYFADGQNDTQIHMQMCDVFPEGIHGMGDNWNYINDWILYKLMRNVLEQGFDVAPDLFYYGIYSIWPNKWTQTQLSTDFPVLCETFAEEGFDVTSLEKWKPDPEQIVANNLQENRIECYACLTYMCPTHGFAKDIRPEFPDGEFFRVEVPLPDPLDQDYCSGHCWKMCELERVIEILNPTDEEKQNLTVIAYINKPKAARDDGEEGLLAAGYGVSSTLPFCQYSERFVDPDDDTLRIRSCREAYEFIMKTVERVSAARLECSRPSKKFDFQKRTRRFRHYHHNTTKDEAPLELIVPLVGCRHPGPCGEDKDTCVCSVNKVCSYLCQCDVNCKLRFPGCNCGSGQCQTKACQCFRVRWECHPSTCKACDCKEHSATGSCSNLSLMKLTSKRLHVAPSKIAGHGLFLLEGAEKDEFITEYVGERITDDEAERRGSIYDRYQTSYIFNLDTGGAIDSYRMGNLSRFANHDSKNPTCYARKVVVGGEDRIAFWAKHNLKPNTELTFDYSYSREHEKIFNFRKSPPRAGRKKMGRPSKTADVSTSN